MRSKAKQKEYDDYYQLRTDLKNLIEATDCDFWTIVKCLEEKIGDLRYEYAWHEGWKSARKADAPAELPEPYLKLKRGYAI